jgi:hypothetical protein
MRSFSTDKEAEPSGANAGRTHPAILQNAQGGCASGAYACREWASYIYALGRIQTCFPTAAIEKEFAQSWAGT